MAVSLAGQNLQVLHLSWGREEMTFLGMLFFFNHDECLHISSNRGI